MSLPANRDNRIHAERPSGARLLQMVWSDLLFLHWPVDADELRQMIPDPLEPDCHGGQAWVGIVPFRMSGARPVLAPPVPGLSSFLEINVRTYVTYNGENGVYFFSLDAANPIAVWFARAFFHLPYFRASIQMKQEEGAFQFAARRTHLGADAAKFDCVWTPGSPIPPTRSGGLLNFLTERYQFFSVRKGRVSLCRVWHERWSLREAKIRSLTSSMVEAAGFPSLQGDPIAHHADRIAVEAWPQHVVGYEAEAAGLLDPALSPPPATYSK